MIHRALSCVLGLVLLMGASGACSPGSTNAGKTELQRVKSGALEVVLLSAHDALRHGADEFIIEFRGTSGNLVDVGNVRAKASMAMSGVPMFGTIEVKAADVPGRYAASGRLEMAGTWRIAIDWDGPQGTGSVTFSSVVQ